MRANLLRLAAAIASIRPRYIGVCGERLYIRLPWLCWEEATVMQFFEV